MKTNLLLLAILACCFASGQEVSDRKMKSHLKEVAKSKEKGSVIWDLDTVYRSGVPYCIIIEKSHGLLPSDYSVKNLDGMELIAVKYNSVRDPNPNPHFPGTVTTSPNISYYTYYFTDTRNMAEIAYGKKVYKTVAEENLIDGDHVNSNEEAKFITMNGMKFSGDDKNQNIQVTQQSSNNNNSYTNLVERDRNKTITIVNNQVNQDFKVVGSVQLTQEGDNGKIVKTYSVFLPDGTKIAEGKCYGITAHNWNVITLKDNQSRTVNSSFNNDAIDIVKWLINAYYL